MSLLQAYPVQQLSNITGVSTGILEYDDPNQILEAGALLDVDIDIYDLPGAGENANGDYVVETQVSMILPSDMTVAEALAYWTKTYNEEPEIKGILRASSSMSGAMTATFSVKLASPIGVAPVGSNVPGAPLVSCQLLYFVSSDAFVSSVEDLEAAAVIRNDLKNA